MRILHVIPALEVGGAERFLGRLAQGLARGPDIEQLIVSIAPIGNSSLLADFEGLRLDSIDGEGLTGMIRGAWRLRKIIREFAPDVIQSWMYRANLMATLALMATQHPSLIWNLRASDEPRPFKGRVLIKLCALISHWGPDWIIACGAKARDFHIQKGYDGERIEVIHNGFRFKPFRSSLRHSPGQELVLGAAGRLVPAKDYGLLLQGLYDLREAGVAARLVIVGRDCTYSSDWLAARIDALQLRNHVDLGDEISDMEEFYNRIDVFCLSSLSEGFPNVLAEAMSFGLPVISTDAGDAAEIVGDAGVIVPISDRKELSAALHRVAEMPVAQRFALGKRAALHVRSRFDLDETVLRYRAVYETMSKRRNRCIRRRQAE